jgi:hypothetical protein
MKEILISNGTNVQPEIRKNAETASDWEYRDEAARLYNLAVIFRDRLVDPILRLDRSQVPDPVISFENLRNNNVLASYTLQRNPQGLLHEITFNTEHYEEVDGKQVWRFGRWAQLETLTHEYLHLKQQKYGATPYKSGRNTHNKEFVTLAKQIGLNVVPVIGCHYQVADERSPFAILMHELGIIRPDDVPRDEGVKIKDDWFEIGKKRKGRSSLSKWSCGCQNAWIGASEFAAHCDKCGNAFVKAAVLREMVKDLATLDPDSELSQMQERFEERQEQALLDDMDRWEDLGMYMDNYATD